MLELRDVTFYYTLQVPVLEHMNVKIHNASLSG